MPPGESTCPTDVFHYNTGAAVFDAASAAISGATGFAAGVAVLALPVFMLLLLLLYLLPIQLFLLSRAALSLLLVILWGVASVAAPAAEVAFACVPAAGTLAGGAAVTCAAAATVP